MRAAKRIRTAPRVDVRSIVGIQAHFQRACQVGGARHDARSGTAGDGKKRRRLEVIGAIGGGPNEFRVVIATGAADLFDAWKKKQSRMKRERRDLE